MRMIHCLICLDLSSCLELLRMKSTLAKSLLVTVQVESLSSLATQCKVKNSLSCLSSPVFRSLLPPPHRRTLTLNYSKGVVRCRDLTHCIDEEIAKELGPQGVTKT